MTMAIKGGRRSPRPETWCHPDKPYASKGLCQSCHTRVWRAANPEGAKQQNKRSQQKQRLRFHGITQEFYEKLLQEQKGLCAICVGPPIGFAQLIIDHNHKTNQVRGLLCIRCNFAIGQLLERPDLFDLAKAYLNKYDEE